MEKIILGLPYLTIEKIESHRPLVVVAKTTNVVKCPHCHGTHLRVKDSFWRSFRNIPIATRSASTIKIKCHKYKCVSCGKYFNTRLQGIAPWSRTTENLKNSVLELINRGVSGKTVAQDLGVGVASVERYYHQAISNKHSQIRNRMCPRILGIDEHRFTKKVGVVTTFCDLAKKRVFDVVKGKKADDMIEFLRSLEGRDRVRVVCIDMCSTYRKLIKEWFRNAKIVSDRFHVIRLVNQHFSELCKDIDNKGLAYGRGGRMRLLLLRREKLSSDQKERLQNYFTQHPSIEQLYTFMHDLNDLLRIKSQNKKQCRSLVAIFLEKIRCLKESGFAPLLTLGKTLYTWRNEVACMFRFTRNNGITEGFHRKMKLIQRQAYGFKNFENYRLRVQVLCS